MKKNALSHQLDTPGTTDLPNEPAAPLLQSERLISDAFYFNPLAAAIVRENDAVFLEVNDAFCRLLEWKRNDILGRSAFDIGMWESREQRLRWADALQQKGELRNYRVDWFTRNGDRRHMSVFSKIIDVDGTPCILSMSRDDSAAIEAEQAAKLATQRLTDIFAFLPDPTFAIDQHGVVIAWNKAEEDETGIPAEEMIGKGNYEVGLRLYGERRPVLADMIIRDDHHFDSRYLVKVRERNTLYGESDNVVLKGQRKCYTAKAGPIIGPDGTIIGAIQQGRDVTAIREGQRKLDHSQQLIRKLTLAIEQSPHGVIITDLRGRIEYANSRALESHGVQREKAIGRPVLSILAHSRSSHKWQELKAHLQRVQAWTGEIVFPRAEADDWVALTSVIPVRQPIGSITNYLVIEQDVTGQKRIEAELEQHRHHLEEQVLERTLQLARAKEAAEAASQAKGEFLANMSHEIRTPLSAILGMARAIRQHALPDTASAQLSKLSGAAQHLLEIVNDILDYSKIEAGKLQLETNAISLSQLIEHTVDLVRERAREKGLALHSEILPGVPGTVKGDSLRIGQILLNYLGNAVKFTERGKVTLRIRRDGDPSASNRFPLIFEVEDTGIGLDRKQAQRLFQAFEQAESSTTRRFGGTGLGLAICKRLAEMMGGSVGLRSQPGIGSVFWLRVDLELASDIQPPSTAEEARNAGGAFEALADRKILVVEDNPLNQEIVIGLLNEVGLHRLTTADHGADALEKAAGQRFDLVLMDMQMPVMDGLEATRRLRARAGWAEIPIIGVTANVFSGDQQACFSAGMSDLITKPIDPDLFHRRLLHWLSKSTTRPASAIQSTPPAPPPTTQQTPPEAPVPAPPPVTATDAQRAALRSLEEGGGVDCGKGLRMLLGKAANYLSMVDRFLAAHCDDAGRIRELLTQEKKDDAVRLAHTVKGLAASLGIAMVQESAAGLEALLREDAPASDIDGALLAMERLLQEIKRRRQAAAPPAEPG